MTAGDGDKIVGFNVVGQHYAPGLSTSGYTEETQSIGATNGHASAAYHRTATTSVTENPTFTSATATRMAVSAVVLKSTEVDTGGGGLPNITTHPTNQAVTAPDPATFTVTATGNPALTYRWRKDGTDINGATSNSYTLNPTSFANDNGAQFDVVVSNTQGSVTSQTATLTVLEASSTVTISSVDFEAGWDIWNDGGSDASRSSSYAAYANSGSYCVRLRDNTSTSVMTTDNLDLSAYSQIEVQFSYYCRSMDNSNEDFWLQISTNGGSSFITIEEWNRNDEFLNDERHNETVAISGISLSSNTKLRFRCDASSNSDYVYIDDVIITAVGN
jgi:hypothetical protein